MKLRAFSLTLILAFVLLAASATLNWVASSGSIEAMVARRAEQSTMARVVKMATEAQAQRSPTQQFTERFERIFVSAVDDARLAGAR